MSQLSVWLSAASIIFFWWIIAKRLGWISSISERITINDQFEILAPVFASLTLPFLVGYLSNLIASRLNILYGSNLLIPLATLCAASLAAFSAYKTIENSRKNERIKNSILALNSHLFQSKNLTKFKSSCAALDRDLKLEPSFKALCRIPSRAREFSDKFRRSNSEEYETIRDVVSYSNNLCYGIKSGIYDEERRCCTNRGYEGGEAR